MDLHRYRRMIQVWGWYMNDCSEFLSPVRKADSLLPEGRLNRSRNRGSFEAERWLEIVRYTQPYSDERMDRFPLMVILYDCADSRSVIASAATGIGIWSSHSAGSY